MNGLTTPRNMGVIIRTAGVGRSTDELQGDLDYLCQFGSQFLMLHKTDSAPFNFSGKQPVIRAVRDYLRRDIGEVLVDDKIIYEDVLNFVKISDTYLRKQDQIYSDEIPLFSPQIRSADWDRLSEVKLPQADQFY